MLSKLCFIILTTLSSEQPIMINVNDITAIEQDRGQGFGLAPSQTTVFYASEIGVKTSSIKETVADVAEKIRECNPSRGGETLTYVIE